MKVLDRRWPWAILIAAIVGQSLAAFAYAWQHPGLTQVQVLQAAAEWIPWRWL